MTVACIDYRKAYDMVPHSWIQKCMKMFGLVVNVRSFVKSWNTDLTASNQKLGNVKIGMKYSTVTVCPHFYLYW